MAECANCNAFTDNPADGRYHYCDDCLREFESIENDGVVVEENRGDDSYMVRVTRAGGTDRGGEETSQVDAIARGKLIADELGCEALYFHHRTGSKWKLEDFLDEHPGTRARVVRRLARHPETSSPGLLTRLKRKLRL